MRACWVVAVWAAGCASAGAEEWLTPPPVASPITDHFALTGGFLWDRVTTFGRFDSASGVQGTPFSPESDLGLTNQADQLRLEIMFRMDDRSRLRVNFFDLRRGAERNIDRTLQYGDVTFSVNDLVKSELDWRQMDLTYTYSFLKTERFELGAGLGMHLIQAEAEATIPGTAQRADFNGAGPFATLAVDGTWRFAQRWSLNARAQYLRLTIGSVSGMLGDYHADLQYRWRRNVAFGIGYERQQMELEVRNKDPSGVMSMHLNGPELFGRLSF